MVTVYRYEHPDSGFGPYNHPYYEYDKNFTIIDKKLLTMMCWRHRNRDGLPNLIGAIRLATGEWRSACSSLAELREWFRGFNKGLKEYGFRVITYEVPAKYVIHGAGQLAFRATKARG